MPRIKRSCIDDIRARVSLVDVASSYTDLKRAGSSYKGLSPFSNEKSPSFFVNPTKNVFSCFSSGNAGDVFHFIQLKENLNFNEAIETLAKRFNVKIDYEDDGTPPEKISLRKELFELHEVAVEYYHQCLLADQPNAAQMREYWTVGRNFSMDIAADFKIGFAPQQDAGLLKALKNKRFSAEAIRQCGLLYVNDYDRDANKARPRFRGRLMIPIRDVQGRPIAFTARQTPLTPEDDPSREAKYINSPETPIFQKSHLLFNLDRARKDIKPGDSFLMVEGQLDAIRCWTSGFKTAVAPQGTAITEQQLMLMRRYTTQINCLLDGDSAGQKAALRMLPLSLKAGLEVSFIPLPPGADPDEILVQEGSEKLTELIAEPKQAMNFAVQSLMPPGKTHSARETAEALSQVFQIISQSDSAIVKSAYLNELSQITKIERSTLESDFRKLQARGGSNPDIPQESQEKYSDKLTTTEYMLLFIALNDNELALKIAETINPEWVNTNKTEGRLLARIIGEINADEWEGTDNLDQLIEDDEERNYAYRLLNEEFLYEEPLREANRNVQKLFFDFYNEEKKQVEIQLTNVPKSEKDSIRELYQKRIELRNITNCPPTID